MISVVTCIGSQDTYDTCLKPSLDLVNNLFKRFYLPELDVITVSGKEFESIAQAYNQAQVHCKYTIRVFIHDDLDMLEPDWVIKLLYAFMKNENIGMIGLTGSTRCALYSPFWWDNGIQHMYGQQYVRLEKPEHWGWNPPQHLQETLNVIDGNFMAVRVPIKFDEQLKLPNLFLPLFEQDTAQQVLHQGFLLGLLDLIAWHKCKTKPVYHETYREDSIELMDRFRAKWSLKDYDIQRPPEST